MMRAAVLMMLIGCAPAPTPQHAAEWVSETKPYGSSSAATAPTSGPTAAPAATAPAAAATLADRYREPVARILAAARADQAAYQKLAYLTDRIGNRLAGSAALGRAVAWAAQAMKDD